MSKIRNKYLAVSPLTLVAIMGSLALTQVSTPAQARSHAQSGIDSICQSTMRTLPNTSDFGACTDTLTEVAMQISQAQVTQDARRACEAKGVKGEGPQMAMCIVDTRRAAPPTPLAIDPGVIQKSALTYTRMNFREQHLAEEQSCAALGLQPEGAGFQGCVHALDAALFDADNPQS
jgi:hypothetical protein